MRNGARGTTPRPTRPRVWPGSIRCTRCDAQGGGDTHVGHRAHHDERAPPAGVEDLRQVRAGERRGRGLLDHGLPWLRCELGDERRRGAPCGRTSPPAPPRGQHGRCGHPPPAPGRGPPPRARSPPPRHAGPSRRTGTPPASRSAARCSPRAAGSGAPRHVSARGSGLAEGTVMDSRSARPCATLSGWRSARIRRHPGPAYPIDELRAIKVVDGSVEWPSQRGGHDSGDGRLARGVYRGVHGRHRSASGDG